MPRSAVRKQPNIVLTSTLLGIFLLLSTLLAGSAQADIPAPAMAPVLEVAESLELAETDLAVASIPLDGPGKARFMNAEIGRAHV